MRKIGKVVSPTFETPQIQKKRENDIIPVVVHNECGLHEVSIWLKGL